MTTINGNTPNVAITTKKPAEKHPVRNTILGGLAGGTVGGAVGYLKQPAKDEVKLGLKKAYNSVLESTIRMSGLGENATKEELLEARQATSSGFRSQRSAIQESIEKGLKYKKGGKYAAIGAAVIGVVALAGTYLFGDKKSEKA